MKQLIVLFLFFSINACATTKVCTSQATQKELNNCIFNKLEKAENILDKEIRNVSKIIPDDKNLIMANALWVKYRDTHCSSVANIYYGGSIHSYVLANCKVMLTESRINLLQSDYKNTVDIVIKGAP